MKWHSMLMYKLNSDIRIKYLKQFSFFLLHFYFFHVWIAARIDICGISWIFWMNFELDCLRYMESTIVWIAIAKWILLLIFGLH